MSNSKIFWYVTNGLHLCYTNTLAFECHVTCQSFKEEKKNEMGQNNILRGLSNSI